MGYDDTYEPYQPPSARSDDLKRLAAFGDSMQDAYKVEYAKSGRSACNGRQPCKGTLIGDGELRLGVWMEFGDMGGGWKFRHWGCVTERQIANMNVALGDDCTQLLGYDDLDNEDQHMIQRAFREGKVPNEDRSMLAPEPPKPKNTRSKSRKQKKEEEDAGSLDDPDGAYGGEADRAYEAAPGPAEKGELFRPEDHPVKEEPQSDDVKPKVEEAQQETSQPKKRTRGQVKQEPEQEDIKPDLGVKKEHVEEKPDVKPKTRSRAKKVKVEEDEEEVKLELVEDVKPKRSLRSRKPASSTTDPAFVHGA